jgi:hypothetical protein
LTTVIMPICLECVHYRDEDQVNFSCDAYPNGIPKEIVESRADHTKPINGDHGVYFKPKYPDKVGEHTGNPLLANYDAEASEA